MSHLFEKQSENLRYSYGGLLQRLTTLNYAAFITFVMRGINSYEKIKQA